MASVTTTVRIAIVCPATVANAMRMALSCVRGPQLLKMMFSAIGIKITATINTRARLTRDRETCGASSG